MSDITWSLAAPRRVLVLILAATQFAAAAPATEPIYKAPPSMELPAGMTGLDVLVAEDEIRQGWADYVLTLDGDGTGDQRAEWARRAFTDDVRWRWFDPDGKLVLAANGRADLDALPLRAPRLRGQSSGKVLPVGIRFDEMTPTTAKTRTVVTYLSVPVATKVGELDGVPGTSLPGIPQMAFAVFHETWRKVGSRWLISSVTSYSSNRGFWPSGFQPTKSCPRPDPKRKACAA